ncbi:MAG: nucleotidyltransferase domain-containing protein [Pseudomonadota bacterium]
MSTSWLNHWGIQLGGEMPAISESKYAVAMRAVIDQARRRLDAQRALRDRARASLPALVAILADDLGAKRVVLFGSLVSGEISETSDLDLLVEGLDPRRYDEALGRLVLASPLPVDLVPLETGRPAVVQRALREGEVLHVT